MSGWYSFFNPVTGQVVDLRWSGPLGDLAANTPPGCLPIAAALDARRHRVELIMDNFGDQVPVVRDQLPPRPADTDACTWRWDLVADDWLPVPTEQALAIKARNDRDARLAACDWLVTRAIEQGTAVPPDWLAYRQALRDISLQPGWPTAVDWPAPPEAA